MRQPDGFERWYSETRPGLIRSLTVASGGDLDIATEATDEAFVRALERWSHVESMDSPTAWTYRTGLNLVRRRFRRRTGESNAIEKLLHTGNRSGADDANLDRFELWSLVAALGERERTALALRYLAAMSEAEVAHAMELTEGGASSLLSRARSRLRKALRAAPSTRMEVPVGRPHE